MRHKTRRAVHKTGLTAAVAVFTAATAVAQNVNNPASGKLTFATKIDANTNRSLSTTPAGTTFAISETLGFSLKSETSTQILSLSGSAGLSIATTGGSGTSTSTTSPSFTLSYQRNAANADLNLSASTRSNNVNSSYLADPTMPTSLIVDTGTRDRTTAALKANLGKNAPFGVTLSANYDNINYTGTTNPALFDSNALTLGATAQLRLSPVTRASLSITRNDTQLSDVLSTTSQGLTYGFGITHDLASGLTISGNLGYLDKRTTASGVTTQIAGLTAGINATQPLVRGSIFGGLKYDATGTTPKTVLNFGRTIDLPNGTLKASIAADWPQGGSARLLGNASYSKTLADGSFSLNLSQSLSTNNLSQDIRYSNLSVAYQKNINSVSGLNLSLGLSRSEDVSGTGAPTFDRSIFSASYNRTLTQDWGLSVGFLHDQSRRTASAGVVSDSVFLTVTRGIQFGF